MLPEKLQTNVGPYESLGRMLLFLGELPIYFVQRVKSQPFDEQFKQRNEYRPQFVIIIFPLGDSKL